MNPTHESNAPGLMAGGAAQRTRRQPILTYLSVGLGWFY